MSTMTPERTRTATAAATAHRSFFIAAVLAIVVGLGSVLGGLVGMVYTWQTAAKENITTPDDAPIAGATVDGPLSLWSQAAIIEEHQLNRTGGLRYSEMPRTVPEVDADGNAVLDENGEQVMVNNAARLSWIDATALITVLNLGLMAYALSLFAIVMGAAVAGLGWVVLRLSRSPALA
ncbi:MAG: hypothetical protein RLZZ353_271 [Actinomycetota bacterium]|jgi:hypothetical protein